MRFGIRGKQIAGVTGVVGLSIVVLSALNAARIAGVVLHESHARAQLIASAIFHRAFEIVPGSPDPYLAMREDPGLRAILESSIYGESITGASIVDAAGTIVADSDPSQIGQRPPGRADLAALVSEDSNPVRQLQVIYSEEGQTLEVQQQMLLGDEAFGSIRVGVSTALMRQAVTASLRPALITALIALAVSVFVAGLLAQLLLRPIHVIRSGLTRLGQGESGVTLDLPPGDEFGDLSTFFNSVSQQLAANRPPAERDGEAALHAADRLEDAVALFNARGELLFTNAAMQPVLAMDHLGTALGGLPAGHPYRGLVEQALEAGASRGPEQVTLGPDQQHLIVCHAIRGSEGELAGILLVARDLAYLSRMHTTLAYSRKLVALGRLTAGIAHEVKNPLNAMMIHLELLRMKIRKVAMASAPQLEPVAARSRGGLGLAAAEAGPPIGEAGQEALQHVGVIESEIRRLDEVVQGFLRFTRPEDLKLQPVAVWALFDELLPVIQAEADKHNVKVVVDAPPTLPNVSGDEAMLRQVFLNLAINACQAMPQGGTLRLTAAPAPRGRIRIKVEDTGVGIPPEHLGKIFDLYFTTKEDGTGLGLAMVYRIVQLHDGEVEVQSTVGQGTTFHILLPRAADA
jgi:signal transduction histidine kinase